MNNELGTRALFREYPTKRRDVARLYMREYTKHNKYPENTEASCK